MLYIKLSLASVIIFVVFRAINFILQKVLKSKKIDNFLKKIIPFIEFVIWSLFFIYVINSTFKDKFYNGTIIIILIVAVTGFFGFYFLKDYLNGIILRLNYNLYVDSYIKIDNFLGKIKKLNYLSLEMESDSHETVNIPYSLITGKKLIFPNFSEAGKIFETELVLEKPKSITQTSEIIKNHILNSPYCLLSTPPIVEFENNDHNKVKYLIRFNSQNKEHADKIIADLEKNIKE